MSREEEKLLEHIKALKKEQNILQESIRKDKDALDILIQEEIKEQKS